MTDPGCRVSYCVRTIRRHILCRVLVPCEVFTFQHHNHCHSQRLVNLFCCEALVRFGLRYYAGGQVVVDTKKALVRRDRLIRFYRLPWSSMVVTFFRTLIIPYAQLVRASSSLNVCFAMAHGETLEAVRKGEFS